MSYSNPMHHAPGTRAPTRAPAPVRAPWPFPATLPTGERPTLKPEPQPLPDDPALL